MKGALRDSAGVRLPLTPGGLLIGRGSACGVMVDDPTVSRRHALVLIGAGVTFVLPMAKSGVLVGGERVHELTRVNDGDEIVVGSARFVVELDAAQDPPKWLLGVGDRRYPVERSGFTVGGAAGDALRIPEWPSGACILHPISDALVLEMPEPSLIDVSGAERDEGYFLLDGGSRLAYAKTELVVFVAGEAPATAERTVLPSEVILELVPHGAVLRVKLLEHHTAFLPQRRGDLVAALLRPPPGLSAGEWIDDDTLVARVWGREGASRTQVNVLIHRARQSLTEAGLNGPTLVERAPGGGATRFRVAAGARVSIV